MKLLISAEHSKHHPEAHITGILLKVPSSISIKCILATSTLSPLFYKALIDRQQIHNNGYFSLRKQIKVMTRSNFNAKMMRTETL